jgi:hypothetical protein
MTVQFPAPVLLLGLPISIGVTILFMARIVRHLRHPNATATVIVIEGKK